MKKYLAWLLALALLLTLTACGTSKEDANQSPPVTVGLVTAAGGIAGDALSNALWKGLQDLAAQNTAVTPVLQEPQSSADYAACMADLQQKGTDLIVCAGDEAAEALQAAARAHPEQPFAFFGGREIDLPNVACPAFDRVQCAYLAGIAAGKLTESDTVCCAQGRFTQENTRLAVAFAAGAYAANSNVQVLRCTTFGDADGGAQDAADMVSRGVDVLYHAEDDPGSAVIRACGTHNIWAIGAYYDRTRLAPENVAASAVDRVDVAVQDMVKAVADGSFRGGVHLYDAANSGIGLLLQEELLPAGVRSAVDSAVNRLKEGTTAIPATVEELEAKYPGAARYF